MEEIDDEDAYPRNVAPLNPSHLLKLRDGSDDEEASELLELIKVDDDLDDEEEEPKESEEAELGQ